MSRPPIEGSISNTTRRTATTVTKKEEATEKRSANQRAIKIELARNGGREVKGEEKDGMEEIPVKLLRKEVPCARSRMTLFTSVKRS